MQQQQREPQTTTTTAKKIREKSHQSYDDNEFFSQFWRSFSVFRWRLISFHTDERSLRYVVEVRDEFDGGVACFFFFGYDRHSLERWAQNKNSTAVRKVQQEQEKEGKKPAKTGKQLLTLLWRPICAGRGTGSERENIRTICYFPPLSLWVIV